MDPNARALPHAPDRRPRGPGPYLCGFRFRSSAPPSSGAYPFVAAVRDLPQFVPDPRVTFLVGENGSGKSTVIEAIAAVAGFAIGGGPLAKDLDHRDWRDSCRALGDLFPLVAQLDPRTGPYKPRDGFFLRAESFFNVAETVDGLGLADVYGGVGLNAQSHGESFLALAANRFGGDSLFIFDEPEAALSVTSQLAFISLIHRSAQEGSQFIIATHSPILLSYPGAAVWEISEQGLERIPAQDAAAVRLTREFLAAPERFLRHLFDE